MEWKRKTWRKRNLGGERFGKPHVIWWDVVRENLGESGRSKRRGNVGEGETISG